jgi:hypothetical protein
VGEVQPLSGMSSSLTTWAVRVAFASSLVACGGSSSVDNPNAGSGGSAGATTVVGATTVGGVGGSGGAAAGGTGGSAGGSSGVDAIALFDSQLPADQQQAWSRASQGKLTPTTLLIAVSSEALSCEAPKFDVNSRARNFALVLVGLPEAMQKPGTYELTSSDLFVSGSTWLSDGQGNGGGGGVTITRGTIEIISIDAQSVDVRFAGLEGQLAIHNRERVATRCP